MAHGPLDLNPDHNTGRCRNLVEEKHVIKEATVVRLC